MNIQELKLKSSEQLITQAEELGIENASTLRKQEILFAILKKVAEKEEITGAGVLQLLQEICGALGSFCDQRSFREPSKCEPPKRAALPVPCQIRFMLEVIFSPFWLQDG